MSKMSEHQFGAYGTLLDALEVAEKAYNAAIESAEHTLYLAEKAFDEGKEKIGL